jgi:hypothetical protein
MTMTATPVPSTARWMASARADQLMLWSWVPFAVLGLLLQDPRAVLLGVSAVLALSFSHQVLTLPLVYGDRDTFSSRRLLFVLAPLVLLVGIAVLRFEAFIALTVVAAGWNAFHTVRQRYGMVRIYGRKVGQDAPGVEQWLLFSGFFAAVALAASSTALESTLAGGALDLGQAGNNTQLVKILSDLRPIALWVAVPLVLLTIALAWRWWTEERSRPQNPAKHWYVGSTMLMYAIAPISPLGALLGFVGSHAIEYYLVVARSLRSRTSTKPASNLARLTAVAGPWPLVAGFALVLTVVVYGAMLSTLVDYGAVAALTLGAMHFLFDGIIWRTGRPAMSASAFTGSSSP